MSSRPTLLIPPEKTPLPDPDSELSAAGLNSDSAEVTMHAATSADITDVEQAERIMKMIDMLEDLDDVQEVYTNVNFSDEVMARLG